MESNVVNNLNYCALEVFAPSIFLAFFFALVSAISVCLSLSLCHEKKANATVLCKWIAKYLRLWHCKWQDLRDFFTRFKILYSWIQEQRAFFPKSLLTLSWVYVAVKKVDKNSKSLPLVLLSSPWNSSVSPWYLPLLDSMAWSESNLFAGICIHEYNVLQGAYCKMYHGKVTKKSLVTLYPSAEISASGSLHSKH